MIALTLLVSLLSVHVLSLPAPDGVVGHGGHGDEYNERPDPFHFEYGVHGDKYHTDYSEQRSGDEMSMMRDLTPSILSMECMMTSITQTSVSKDLVMRVAAWRESTPWLSLMGVSSM